MILFFSFIPVGPVLDNRFGDFERSPSIFGAVKIRNSPSLFSLVLKA